MLKYFYFLRLVDHCAMDQLPNLNEHEDDTRDTIEGIFCNLFKRNKEQMTSSVEIVFIVFNLKPHLKVLKAMLPKTIRNRDS